MLQHAEPSHESLATADQHPTMSYHQVRQRLLDRVETALIDVREEDPFAQEHPLWAANFPLSRLELQAWSRIARRDTVIVVYGHDELGDLAVRAADVLVSIGYTQVFLLEHGLQGWKDAGGEIFRDVNVPSKSFGELLEAKRHTPSLSAQQVQQLLQDKSDVVVLDARRFDEYQTMNIPGSTSVPGAELVLRARELAIHPQTRIIVNCAGRTRSIVGAQSLINAGLPNAVAALRNGTIGWTLAGQQLEHGADRRFGEVSTETLQTAQIDARKVANAAGVRRIRYTQLSTLQEATRSLYLLDVRTPQEYAAGHLPGFWGAPGGQLVQETDHIVPVRGARIVLADRLQVRADMTASWLAQMGWEAYVVDGAVDTDYSETGVPTSPAPAAPQLAEIAPLALHALLQAHAKADTPSDVLILDFTSSANYIKRQIPGAHFAIRAQLPQILATLHQQPTPPSQLVFTCGSSQLARFAAQDAARLTHLPITILRGGTLAWIAQNLPVSQGANHLASPQIDRYRRPYEGTDAPHAAMQAYLDWEFGLVEQLGRDGTHHFQVL